jgi:Cu(I)/Ag(I) efflux system membrane fusion protein
MGQRVRKGEILFTLYSPELYSAQEEYLAALGSQSAAAGTSAPARADYLVGAARERLRLWDLRDWQIDQLAERGSPLEHIPVVSPVGGVVIEKMVVEGGAVEPGMKLYRIAGLETVWVEAEVYESELSLVSVGQEAEVILPYLTDKRFHGKVSFVYPYLGDQTRTGRVRIELSNPNLELRPDMYADVELSIDRGDRLVVPVEAVLHAGPRRLVFLDLGKGRLKPQEVEIGVKSGDEYEVLGGLEEGDVVVASGNFLIAAESRLKSAVEQW